MILGSVLKLSVIESFRKLHLLRVGFCSGRCNCMRIYDGD